MATSKGEMIALIEKMSETVAATEWFQARNAELKDCLDHVSVSSVRFDRVGGRSGVRDSAAEEVLKREDIEAEIKINERAIRERLSHHAQLSLVMGEVLSHDERTVIWARHADKLPWDRVAWVSKRARTACFMIEKDGMEKLCRAWDRAQEEKKKKEDSRG